MNKWKIHFRTPEGTPLCGHRLPVILNDNRDGVTCFRCVDRLGASTYSQVVNRLSGADRHVLMTRALRSDLLSAVVPLRTVIVHDQRDAELMAGLLPCIPSHAGRRELHADRAFAGLSEEELEIIKAEDYDGEY